MKAVSKTLSSVYMPLSSYAKGGDYFDGRWKLNDTIEVE